MKKILLTLLLWAGLASGVAASEGGIEWDKFPTDKASGVDYLYTYLRSYYRDDTKATGWNNLAFPSVAMPHVLWELQGQRAARFEEVKDPHDEAKTEHRFAGFEQRTPGKMSAVEY